MRVMRRGLAVLDPHVGDGERHVDQPHAELERCLVLRDRARRSTGSWARRCDAARRLRLPLASSPASMRSAETVW